MSHLKTKTNMEDYEVYRQLEPAERFITNKLAFSELMGYECGPAGMPVNKPGYYMVRPERNLYGMGLGATMMYLTTGFSVQPGYFWQEIFYGQHLSVDYEYGLAKLCVSAYKVGTHGLQFKGWRKLPLSEAPPFPVKLNHLVNKPIINIEFIGGKPIEIHFRGNPDFEGHNHDCLEVVWEGDPREVDIPAYENCNGLLTPARKGFIIC